ncbi:MAG: tRNA (N6-threonylcarbamoyladenosine(37)-N6)-methyltransferase TrmO [Paludibacteraceae bacterium]|nr:tRNA (N6-threonylcarbamoyladenosine(37)-N6)-methyltransferase TrmO [Paludibacteraceae bacterium]
MITIAYARNGFADKFGIPRQPLRDSIIETKIVFTEEYRVAEALRGIEGFSHLWLLWGFNNNNRKEWSPTVRPPRLGGNRRVGVFATRSPIRPNPIGLTAVRLLEVRKTDEGQVLIVAGADLQDGTPIYDIKPYIAYSDAIPDAKCGFVDEVDFPMLDVVWGNDARNNHDSMGIQNNRGYSLVSREEWEDILRQDPRPAYQDDPNRIYHITYKNEELSFRVEGKKLIVTEVSCVKYHRY